MRLTDRFDGSAAPFEGDRTLEIRSLPANARVSKATITLTPLAARGGGLFEETIIPGGDARVSRGATKFSGTGFVEVDLHQRRTLRAVEGSNLPGAKLQVEMGGIYLQLNQAGAIKSSGDAEFSVQNDRKLPGLTVSKFKLTRDLGAFDVTSVTVASVPLNVTARIGNLPPFFARVGEMSQEQVSPDFAASLQAFLAEAPVENGFCVVPLVLHSDLIARITVSLVIDYVVEDRVLPADVGEPLLPFGEGGQAQTENTLLTLKVPANRRIARRGIQGRVTGKFDDTRILHPSPLPLVPVKESGRVVSIASDSTLAQPIKLGVLRVATSVDLLLAVRRRGALQLDLREDADGKPGSLSLLPGPARFEPAPLEDITARWLSVPLPAEFQFKEGTRYWLVLQTLEGEADWRVEPAPKPLGPEPEPGMQRTQDDALSWREAVPPEAGDPFTGLFRLRGRTTPYRMPIEMRVGPPDPTCERLPQRVLLDQFAVSGRVDFTLDFEELSQAANAYLDSATAALPAIGEHLVNGDFRDWLAIGDRANHRVDIDLDTFVPIALALAPNGSRAYLAGSALGGQHPEGGTFLGSGGMLRIVDLACSRLLDEETVILGGVFPRALALSPDGSRAYVGGRDQLLLVDLTTGTLSSDALSIPGIFALAGSPDGGLLYVTTFHEGQAGLQAIDTAALENFLFAGEGDEQKITLATSPLDFGAGAFVAVSPNGEHVYVTSAEGEFQVLDVDRFSAARNAIFLGGGATGIAITPDGSRALVPSASPAQVVAIVDLAGGTVAQVPLGAVPLSLAITSDGASAYVAMADRRVSIIDLERSTLRAETIELSAGIGAGALALRGEGDRLAMTNAVDQPTGTGINSLTVIELGVAWPNEWNVITGEVRRYCFPGVSYPVALLGSFQPGREDNAPAGARSAISQVVPVVAAGRYEISFRALATNANAFAEVIWRGQNGEAFPAERVPIQAAINGHSAVPAARRNALPVLASHRKQLIAPESAEQAEIRFIAEEGTVAAIAQASFTGASERIVNGDFSLREENGLSAWTLLPATSAGVTLLTSAGGIRVQNSGARPVELVQSVSAETLQFFTLEFEGRVVRPSTETNPQVQLQWLRDGSPVGEPTRLEISADGLAVSAAQGRSPDATEAEIRLAVPNGAALEVTRISLRFTEAIPLTLNFIAEAPGELAVTDLHVAFVTAPAEPPLLPDDGLFEASPMADAPCGERLDDEASFCPCCQRVQPLVDSSRRQTETGRPVLVGRCRGCGAEVPRFGGRSERGAAPFALRRGQMAPPIILDARAPRPSANTPAVVERISPAEALMNIDLIGPKRAERLVAQGIDTPAKLAETSAEEIVKLLKPGVSRQQAEQMRTEARSPTS